MMAEEWPGQTSAKFTTWKQHTRPIEREETDKHPLFYVNQRKHFVEPRSETWKFRQHAKTVIPIDHNSE